VPEDLSLLGHDAVLLGEKRLHSKSSSPFFLHDATPKNAATTILWTLWYLSNDTALCPRRLESAAKLLSEPAISQRMSSHQETPSVTITPAPHKCQNCAAHSALCLPCTCSCTYLTKASVILFSMNVRTFTSLDSISSQRWGMWLGLLHFLRPEEKWL
jgi:hypothetical protein